MFRKKSAAPAQDLSLDTDYSRSPSLSKRREPNREPNSHTHRYPEEHRETNSHQRRGSRDYAPVGRPKSSHTKKKPIGQVTLHKKLTAFLEKHPEPHLGSFVHHKGKTKQICFLFRDIFFSNHSFSEKLVLLRGCSRFHDIKFFHKCNMLFFESLTKKTCHGKQIYSNYWNMPQGLLQSFQQTGWFFYFKLESGFNFYSPSSNIFSLTKISRPVLLNPPYEEDSKDFVWSERSKPLYCHIKFWIKMAQQCQKHVVLVLPFLKTKSYYHELASHPFCGMIHLKNKLIFSKGENHELFSLANFKTTLLVIGVKFHEVWVPNNCLGNFVLKNSAFQPFIQKFGIKKVPSISAFSDFIEASKIWNRNVCAAITKFSPSIPFSGTLPIMQDFSLGNPQTQTNNLDLFRAKVVSHWDSRNFYTFVNAEKKPDIVSFSEFKKREKKKNLFGEKSVWCSHCRSRTHTEAGCFKLLANSQKINCPDDLKLVKFFSAKGTCNAWYLKKQHDTVPDGDLLDKVLEKIDTEALILEKEITQLNIQFSTSNTYSQTRNHIHFVHLLGAKPFELINFSIGFDPTVAFEGEQIPHLHIGYKPPPPPVLADLWEQTLKDLKANKIFWVPAEILVFAIPIFLIVQLNNFGQEKKRLINNFNPLKHFIHSQPFKLHSMDHLQKICEGALVLILDIKSAYPTLQLLFANFFGFSLFDAQENKNHFFASKSPLFGVQFAPFICHLALLFFTRFLNTFALFTSIYIDDFFIIISQPWEQLSHKQSNDRISFVVNLFARIGIFISDKIVLESTTFPLYTGRFFSTYLNSFFPNPIKVILLQDQILEILHSEKTTLHILQSIQSKFKWVVKRRRHNFSVFINHIISNLARSMKMPLNSKEDFAKFYATEIYTNDHIVAVLFAFISEINHCFQISPLNETYNFAVLITDASPTNGGAFLILPNENFETFSFTLPETRHQNVFSSTMAELEAVWYALNWSLPIFKQHQIAEVRILNDNKALTQNFQKSGSKKPLLHSFVVRISTFLYLNKINFEIRWHPRSVLFAEVADRFSKASAVTVNNLVTFLEKSFNIHTPAQVYKNSFDLANFTPKFFHRQKNIPGHDVFLIFVFPLDLQFLEFSEVLSLVQRLPHSFCFITPSTQIAWKTKLMQTYFDDKFSVKTLRFPSEILHYPFFRGRWNQAVFTVFR